MWQDDEQKPLETSQGAEEETPTSSPGSSRPAGEEIVSAEETPTPSPETSAPVSEEIFSMDEALEQTFRTLETGEIIEATVVQVERESVLVDVGTKTEGVIPLEELSEQRLDSAEGVVSVGDKINVMVLQPHGEEGNPVLSKKLADFEILWERIEDAFQNGNVLYAMVVERVKGGLVVDLGVRGFIPASHVGVHGSLRNLDRLVGQSLPIKIMDLDRERRKVIASNKKAEEELYKERQSERLQRQREIFARLQVGQILEGEVKRLTPYGAFVDIGGYEGLLHVSEMSWSRVEDPRDVLSEGDQIQVMVLRLDPEKGKVSLGLRQVLPDPWSQIPGKYHVGETIQVPISRVVRSGAFARLPEGVEAFIPISELSNRRVRRVEDVVSVGRTVEALIIELNPDQRRMVMSLRALQEEAERKQTERAMSRFAARSGGFTIADRLQGQLEDFLLPGEKSGQDSKEEVEAAAVENESVPLEEIRLQDENPDQKPEKKAGKKSAKSESLSEES